MNKSLMSCLPVEIRRLVVFLAVGACVMFTQGPYVTVSAMAAGPAGVTDGPKDKNKDKDKGPNSVPEPATTGLIALGAASIVWYRHRQRSRKQ
jgi:hypothetical protein